MNRKLAALGAACALACAALPAVTWANGYSGGSGVAIPPMVTNPAQRVTTYTAITGAGSQMICPAITAIGQAVVAEEVSVSVGGGLGLAGQSLSGPTLSTAAGSPDILLAASQLYSFPVPTTGAVTFYGSTSGIVACTQTSLPH